MLYRLIVTLAFQEVSTTFLPLASTTLVFGLDFFEPLVGFFIPRLTPPTSDDLGDPADDARDDPAEAGPFGVLGGFGTIAGIAAGGFGVDASIYLTPNTRILR